MYIYIIYMCMYVCMYVLILLCGMLRGQIKVHSVQISMLFAQFPLLLHTSYLLLKFQQLIKSVCYPLHPAQRYLNYIMYITKMHMNVPGILLHTFDIIPHFSLHTHSTYICLFIADSKGRLFPLFSSSQHGESFSTLVGRIVKQGPVLLVLRDTGGNVFGGFASQSWTISPEFTGDDIYTSEPLH